MKKKTIIIIGIVLLTLISGTCFYIVKHQKTNQLFTSKIPQTQAFAQAEQQTPNTASDVDINGEKDDYTYFIGAINNSMYIHLKCKIEENKLTGSYYYDKYKTDIMIDGEIDKVKNVSIIEYDVNGNQTGKFVGKYVSGDRIEGIWSDKKSSFPFYLELENTNTKPTLSINSRVVKMSIANTYNHMIDYDLKFVHLTGTYKGIDAINEYYNSKERDDFFGKENNDWFNAPYPYDDHFQLQFYYQAEVRYGNILSISGGGNFWAGGVNNPTIYSDIFDLNTGNRITLGDIFKVSKEEYLSLIYDEVAKGIKKEIAGGQNRYNFEDAYSTEGKAAIEKFQPENFYLTGKSLVVFYPKYSLGDGAAGTFEFDIPLDSIKDKLKINLSEKQLF